LSLGVQYAPWRNVIHAIVSVTVCVFTVGLLWNVFCFVSRQTYILRT
jgi:hypothetical protein